jgi:hypothetical protein
MTTIGLALQTSRGLAVTRIGAPPGDTPAKSFTMKHYNKYTRTYDTAVITFYNRNVHQHDPAVAFERMSPPAQKHIFDKLDGILTQIYKK